MGASGTRASHTLQRAAATEAQRFQVGQPQPTHCPRHVAQRVASYVTVLGLVGRRSDAHTVQHHEGYPATAPGHAPPYSRVARSRKWVSAS
jgi:hypothetical protein